MNEHQSQLSLSEIKRRAVIGVFALTSRSWVISLIKAAGNSFLLILLDPAAYGLFFLVSASISFLNYFSDIGLAAALIQKKSEPSRSDLVTTFTLQQGMVGGAVGVALIFSKTITQFYNLQGDGLFLFRAYACAFFLSSLKTIPSVLLERKLDFQKLIIPQIAEEFVFYTTAVVLASRGFGVLSYAWATLLRGLVGVIILYIVSPWRFGIGFEKKNAKDLLSFGLPFQFPAFLALIKDDLITLFIGKLLPLSSLGYIGFGKKVVELMMRQQIMDNVVRVTFPTYARLQHDLKNFGKAIEKTITFLALISLPVTMGMIMLMRPLIHVVPGLTKWEPALPSYYLLTISFFFAIFSSPFYNALNALGKVKQTLGLMIFWTALTWLTVPVGIMLLGFNGYAAAALIINLTSFIPLFMLKKTVPFSFFKQIINPTIAACGLFIILVLVNLLIHQPLLQIILGVTLGAVVYAGMIYLLMGAQLRIYLDLLVSKKSL